VAFADALLIDRSSRDGAAAAAAAVAVAASVVDAQHVCAGTMELTSTTTRIVPLSGQAAYRILWRAMCGGRDSPAHPYAAAPTVALTTPAGSWLVHACDLE
jgi:hypothetical protein